MNSLHIFTLLMASAILFVSIALRWRIPYPVALVIGGAAIGFVPYLPEIHFDPNLLLSIVLPPILFYAAFNISIKEFKHEFFDILWLALGLVIVTTLAAGCLFKWLFPDLPWALAFTFGAIVSPPDAVAATTIFKKFSVNPHLQAVLEGESLVNDATGLVLYKMGVAAVLSGIFSPADAVVEFIKVAAGGILIGIITGYALHLFSSWFLSPILAVIYSFIIPYIAYLIADELQVSGVLAVVVNGLIGSRLLITHFSSMTRVVGWVSWDIFIILLNCFVFILIGLQLNGLVKRITLEKAASYLGYSILITAALILVRCMWIFFRQGLLSLQKKESPHDTRNNIILSWAGMRGIVSMAAALALPYSLPDGSPFPGRDIVIFLTFCVIFLTLVLPGITLSKMLKVLRIRYTSTNECKDIRDLLGKTVHEELHRLHALKKIDDDEYTLLTNYFKMRHQIMDRSFGHRKIANFESAHQQVLDKKRQLLIQMWKNNEITDELFQRFEREIDIEEAPIVRAEI